MKLSLKILAIAAIAASTFPLISCAGPTGFSYQNITISLVAQCSDCPLGITFNPSYPVPTINGVAQQALSTSPPIPAGAIITQDNQGEGGTIEFLATVTGAPPANVYWSIYPTPNLGSVQTYPTGGNPPGESGSSVGTFSTPAGTTTTAQGATAYYVQGGTPVYGGAALEQAEALGIPQGNVMIVAGVPTSPTVPVSSCVLGASGCVFATQLVQIFNGNTANVGPPSVYLSPKTPTNPAGLTTPVAFVSHLPPNNTYQFYGGVVGAAPCTTQASCLIQGIQYPIYTADDTPIWEVGSSTSNAIPCTVASICPYGTISSTGLYTAPPVIPPGGTAVIVIASQILPTTTAFAYITVN
jgi:hypothetical protein